MTGLLIAGTSSDAGKSLVTAALCRSFARRGVDVVPFKAQNMSNNSMVCADGEIGRAQYLQAQAAGVTPTTAMNPVLIKPSTDRRAFVVVRGQPDGTLEAGEYATGRTRLRDAAFAAYRELAAAHELVVCEGAGSPAEINLRSGDYVNMGLARQFDLPVVLVGDIDRGGVLASIFGTWALLDDADRRLLAGYAINKFRGDQAVLDPGLADLTARTGLPSFGVLPWIESVWLDSEDALALGGWSSRARPDAALRVAVIPLPRISNGTDVDALACEPGVEVTLATDPHTVAAADLVVLPGTRATTSDLAWLRERGLASALADRARADKAILGICGGYQMLAEVIDDDVEGRTGRVPGLGLLPVGVRFEAAKHLGRPRGTWRGAEVEAYEIHHGVCEVAWTPQAEPFLDGVRVGQTFGTLWHGTFECDDFRRAFLTEVAAGAGLGWRPDAAASGFAGRREAMLELLADAVDAHLDVPALLDLARRTPGASGSASGSTPASGAASGSAPDLALHGDAELAPGLVDLAVNVRTPKPAPVPLARVLERADAWAAYPDPAAARRAIAAAHGVDEAMVLTTAGSAEAFTLIARAIDGRAGIVHPQFTVPEQALLAAGRRPARHLLDAAAGFALDPALADVADELLVVGNPTNPTGVLHPAADLRALARPGRVLVVDEAFMDAVPDEPESLIGAAMDGILVTRSITKTWGLAGLRAGYVVGDPRLIALLAAQQPPWPVSAPALDALVACAAPNARGHAAAEASALVGRREHLVAALAATGLASVPGAAPFVLVDTAPLGPGSVREPLAARGFAVRRGESFPGLGPTWIRVAVRDRATHDALAAAMADLKETP